MNRMNFPVSIPGFIKWVYPKYTWRCPYKTPGEKPIFLTFDDGPTPGITPWVLAQLEEFGAKATFFLVGNNIDRFPSLVSAIRNAGHTIGNHTQDHLNGWRTPSTEYINNVKQTQDSLDVYFKGTVAYKKLMRPPYGKIKRHQANLLMECGYSIIMYDVLARDWDHTIAAKKCIENVLKNAKNGSIVVFHDSRKAEKNLKKSLPKILYRLQKRGFDFKGL